MPKVLVCASTGSHIQNFHLPYLAYFKKRGFEVHVAVPDGKAFDAADTMHFVPMSKKLISSRNLCAVVTLRHIIASERYDLILVHTTLAAFVTRLAMIFIDKMRPCLINTVHGYLFWKGGGFFRQALYYIPERLLRCVTDCIITLNSEDYAAAGKLVNKGGLVANVHGMGVNATRFVPATGSMKRAARHELSIPEDKIVIVYAARFVEGKNHIELLNALAKLVDTSYDILLLLCGSGKTQKLVEETVSKLQLDGYVRFMGWCEQMEKVYQACDLAVSASRSEGLPFNVVEAQLCALPVVASSVRGHRDLIRNGENGYLYTLGNVDELAETMLKVLNSPAHALGIGAAARASAEQFSLDTAYRENTEVYQKMFDRIPALRQIVKEMIMPN